MAKRAGPPVRTNASSSSTETTPQSSHNTARVDRLIEIIDQCVVAKAVADKLGEKLLAYLLAMAIQEARSNLQSKRERGVSGVGIS